MTDFRVPDVLASSATTEYSPTSPGLFTLMSVSHSPDDISAILENTSFYRVHLNNTVLFDAKGNTSLSRKMAVLKPCALPESPKYHSKEESSWSPFSNVPWSPAQLCDICRPGKERFQGTRG